MIKPFEEREFMCGIQKLYKFRNGYGASVVSHRGSYGGLQGLWELAVIIFYGDARFDLTYDTPIITDVIGHLDNRAVQDILKQIRKLPRIA